MCCHSLDSTEVQRAGCVVSVVPMQLWVLCICFVDFIISICYCCSNFESNFYVYKQIKKFKDALAKHGTDRCGLGPAKGLDEAEILKLVSVGELSINFPVPSTKEERLEDLLLKGIDFPEFLTKTGKEEAAMV